MEYIVKYHGDLSPLGYPMEILSCRYAILDLDPAGVQALRQFSQVEYYEPSELLSPLMRQGLASACITPVQRDMGLTGQGVVVGLLDSGIDWRHPEFLTEDGHSRVLSIWDMTLSGTPPVGFFKGRELTGDELTDGEILVSGGSAEHGTAVASIAAGNSGAAPGASIVAVKLGSGSPRSTDIMRGVKYILGRAQELKMPCVVNLSYGTNNGSHQGASLFETFMDEMAQQWKTVIVCAAGNEGDAGHHFHGRFTQELPVEFNVATLRESVYLSLWKNFVDVVSFQLVLPDGRATPLLSGGEAAFSFGAVTVTVIFRGPVQYSGSQEVFFRMRAAPGGLNGLWTLRCFGHSVTDGEFHVWLPTVEEVTAKTSFQTPDPDLTITLPATASQPISVGGYRAAAGTLSAFSGRGDGLCRGRTLLDLTAPAENIRAARAGGGYDSFTGTSMAAPFVSGAAALMMEWGIVQGNDPYLYGQRVKGFLCKNAVRSTFQDYPNRLWGYGKLDLCAAMRDLVNQMGGILS